MSINSLLDKIELDLIQEVKKAQTNIERIEALKKLDKFQDKFDTGFIEAEKK